MLKNMGIDEEIQDDDQDHSCEDVSESSDDDDISDDTLGGATPNSNRSNINNQSILSGTLDNSLMELKFSRKERKKKIREMRNQKKEFRRIKYETQRLRILQARKERPDYSENILQELKTEYLGLVYLRAKKEVDDFLDIFNLEPSDKIDDSLLTPEGNHPMKTVFQEICFVNRIKAYLVQKYYKFILKRKRDIEKVINSHFHLIKMSLIEKRKAEFEK